MLPKKTKINTCTWNGALGIGFDTNQLYQSGTNHSKHTSSSTTCTVLILLLAKYTVFSLEETLSGLHLGGRG